MRTNTVQTAIIQNPVPVLTPSEIDDLLKKLARGHISTQQEEYADLKKVLASA